MSGQGAQERKFTRIHMLQGPKSREQTSAFLRGETDQVPDGWLKFSPEDFKAGKQHDKRTVSETGSNTDPDIDPGLGSQFSSGRKQRWAEYEQWKAKVDPARRKERIQQASYRMRSDMSEQDKQGWMAGQERQAKQGSKNAAKKRVHKEFRQCVRQCGR